MQPMLMAPLRPVRSELARRDGSCGVGLFYPFAFFDYWAFEEVRGTNCALSNPMSFPRAGIVESVRLDDRARFVSFVSVMRCAG